MGQGFKHCKITEQVTCTIIYIYIYIYIYIVKLDADKLNYEISAVISLYYHNCNIHNQLESI